MGNRWATGGEPAWAGSGDNVTRVGIGATERHWAFTAGVIATLAEQSAGNLRTLMHLADQALTAAIDAKATCVDEGLLLAAVQPPPTPTGRQRSHRRSRA